MSYVRRVYDLIPFKYPVDKAYYMLPDCCKYGMTFNKNYKYLSRTQWWSREKHEEECLVNVRRLLIHSYEHTKYYKRLFDQCGFNPYSFKSFYDMEMIPFLDRDIISSHYDELIADNIPLTKTYVDSTGGTTGNQLYFLNEKRMKQIERAFVMQIWQRVGFHYGRDLLAVLRNDVMSVDVVYQKDVKHNRILFNNFNLTDDNLKKVVQTIHDMKISFLHAYPSSAINLAEYIKQNGLKGEISFKSILLTSENIYPGQKEMIEEMLGGKCHSFYGHSEHAGIAWWCKEGSLYHIDDEYGYMELVDNNGQLITEHSHMGEIVCTGIWNYAMPFIRYRTGDYAKYSVQQECPCGRHYRLLDDIYGRWTQEMIKKRDGTNISMTSLNMHSELFDNVISYQMVQNKIGEMDLLIVKGKEYKEMDELRLKKEYRDKLGEDFVIRIKYVDEIEKTKRGKHRYFIQNIDQ